MAFYKRIWIVVFLPVIVSVSNVQNSMADERNAYVMGRLNYYVDAKPEDKELRFEFEAGQSSPDVGGMGVSVPDMRLKLTDESIAAFLAPFGIDQGVENACSQPGTHRQCWTINGKRECRCVKTYNGD
jgi:hypothetical protein